MSVTQFNNLIGNKIHETEKPLELIEHYMMNSTNDNDWVLDPFGGSMVLNIAGIRNNRKVFSIEKAHSYVTRGTNRIKNYLIFNEDRNIKNTIPPLLGAN